MPVYFCYNSSLYFPADHSYSSSASAEEPSPLNIKKSFHRKHTDPNYERDMALKRAYDQFRQLMEVSPHVAVTGVLPTHDVGEDIIQVWEKIGRVETFAHIQANMSEVFETFESPSRLPAGTYGPMQLGYKELHKVSYRFPSVTSSHKFSYFYFRQSFLREEGKPCLFVSIQLISKKSLKKENEKLARKWEEKRKQIAKKNYEEQKSELV